MISAAARLSGASPQPAADAVRGAVATAPGYPDSVDSPMDLVH